MAKKKRTTRKQSKGKRAPPKDAPEKPDAIAPDDPAPSCRICCGRECGGCVSSGGDPIRAVWRKRDGRDTFTGIVAREVEGRQALVKLHDAGGPLDGPGHEMGPEEFLSECAHYDGYEGRPEITRLSLVDYRRGAPRSDEEMEALLGPPYELVGLADFADKPVGVADSQSGDYDDEFPFASGGGGCPPRVRAGDMVRLMATGIFRDPFCSCPNPFCGDKFRERFWVRVASVTPFGIVTGQSTNDLRCCGIGAKSGLLSFPVTAVMGMMRGKNWGSDMEGQPPVQDDIGANES